VNFLIKIEEAINRFIEKLLNHIKELTPPFVFSFLHFIKNLPQLILKKANSYIPKMRIMGLKFIGYTEHYTTMIRGTIMSFMMYLRSEEFKSADKGKLLLKPLQYAKVNPLKALSAVLTVCILAGTSMVIYQNAEKIVQGTKALRKPASYADAEDDIFIELKHQKFEVKVGAPAAAGGHGHEAAGEAHEYEIYLDIKMEAANDKEKAFLEEMEEVIDDSLEAMELPVTQLPLIPENQKHIEESILKILNEDMLRMGHADVLKNIKIKQVFSSRPVYYRQTERMLSIEEINLQLFLEDTHRNRQVWVDFSVLASNRNVILYLKDHNVELKDHLTTNVEPVIPQLPIEAEGRQIIKEKLRFEINKFLEDNHIEGKILEIYIDYLLAS
jgi:hypothetical protein